MSGPAVLLTWEYGERVSDGGDVDPTLVIFLHTSCALLPVRVVFALVRGTDEESSDVILGGNDQQAIVGVTPDATARLAFTICLVGGRKSEILVSNHPLSIDEVAPGLTVGSSYGAIRPEYIAAETPGEHPGPTLSRQEVSLQSLRDSSCKTSWGLASLRQAKGRAHGMATS